MSPSKPSKPKQLGSNNGSKLAPLPKHARIQKRPILHPPIPSPYTNSTQQKVVYVSAKTPFISAVKRVRTLLEHADNRAVGQLDLLNDNGNDKQRLKTLGGKLEKAKKKPREEVVLKATNRAIEKVLGLAVFFQGQADCGVRIRTGGVGVVDDIVEDTKPTSSTGPDGDGEDDEELPESRIRKLSVVEVAVTLR